MPRTKEDLQAYLRKYYQEHREIFLARAAAYEAANREKVREYRRNYFQNVTKTKRTLRWLEQTEVVPEPVVKTRQRRSQPPAPRPLPSPQPQPLVKALPAVTIDWS